MGKPAQAILDYLEKHESAGGRELREHLGISRQALHLHLRGLLESGKVIKSGSTRAARYSLASRAPAGMVVQRDLSLEGLHEDRVYDDVALNLGFRRQLPPSVEEVVRYAFTEMLNNAIDHSESERARVRVQLDPGTIAFEVRDDGIGVFHSIAAKAGLPDENAAMIELLKGKTTTMPERHSGEGLFFTARAADRFTLRSHRIQVEWDHSHDDVFVGSTRLIRGTLVRFVVSRNSRRKLKDLFGRYAPAEYDFQFQKTLVRVKLLQKAYVSRSEAKRLLSNLHKFREAILDFRDVESVGQGFADEVFRVFARRHPETKIVAENAGPAIQAMLTHVKRMSE